MKANFPIVHYPVNIFKQLIAQNLKLTSIIENNLLRLKLFKLILGTNLQ